MDFSFILRKMLLSAIHQIAFYIKAELTDKKNYDIIHSDAVECFLGVVISDILYFNPEDNAFYKINELEYISGKDGNDDTIEIHINKNKCYDLSDIVQYYRNTGLEILGNEFVTLENKLLVQPDAISEEIYLKAVYGRTLVSGLCAVRDVLFGKMATIYNPLGFSVCVNTWWNSIVNQSIITVDDKDNTVILQPKIYMKDFRIWITDLSILK